MNFFFIQPKDKSSFSRRWFVDDVGLEIVKQNYSFYGREGEEKIDRWDDFKCEPTDTIWFDFGGMMYANTTNIKEIVCGIKVDIMITHTEVLLGALLSNKLLSPTYWKCATRYNTHIYSLDFHKELKRVFKEKEKQHEKLCKEFYDMVDLRIKKSKEII